MKTGDRLAILFPQCPETAISHIAVYKAGGIAIPLFTLFGPDAPAYRLADSETRFVVTNKENFDKFQDMKSQILIVHCQTG